MAKSHRPPRPSNRERTDELKTEMERLRGLISHRHHSDKTWKLIAQLVAQLDELDELSTPLQGISYDEKPSRAVERPILPGVHITNDGRIVHSGTYAEQLKEWLIKKINWTIDTVDARLQGREQQPEPPPPKRFTVSP